MLCVLARCILGVCVVSRPKCMRVMMTTHPELGSGHQRNTRLRAGADVRGLISATFVGGASFHACIHVWPTHLLPSWCSCPRSCLLVASRLFVHTFLVAMCWGRLAPGASCCVCPCASLCFSVARASILCSRNIPTYVDLSIASCVFLLMVDACLLQLIGFLYDLIGSVWFHIPNGSIPYTWLRWIATPRPPLLQRIQIIRHLREAVLNPNPTKGLSIEYPLALSIH
mgnify:CR=1 FL=1